MSFLSIGETSTDSAVLPLDLPMTPQSSGAEGGHAHTSKAALSAQFDHNPSNYSPHSRKKPGASRPFRALPQMYSQQS